MLKITKKHKISLLGFILSMTTMTDAPHTLMISINKPLQGTPHNYYGTTMDNYDPCNAQTYISINTPHTYNFYISFASTARTNYFFAKTHNQEEKSWQHSSTNRKTRGELFCDNGTQNVSTRKNQTTR